MHTDTNILLCWKLNPDANFFFSFNPLASFSLFAMAECSH